MDPLVVVAALTSAFLHAAWNAAAKSRSDPGEGFAVVVYAAGVIALPLLLLTGPPAAAAWPWIAAGVVLNVISMRALMAAYRRTSFSVSFPLARGLTPALVALAAWAFAGEALGARQSLGIAAIVVALLLLAGNALQRGEASVSGIVLAIASSAFAAGYVFMDAQGVRAAGSLFAYAFAIAVINAIVLGSLGAAEGRPPWRISAAGWRFGLIASLISMASYMLVLWAFTNGPIGPVSALRETSVLFATAFAALALRERVGLAEWLAAMIAVFGIGLIRLG